MFKLPDRPTARDGTHALADFVELLAWVRKAVSTREIVALLGREGEAEPNQGCDDVDDEAADALGDVMNEIERRKTACRDRYPFAVDTAGNVLRYRSTGRVDYDRLYGYLLLSTRLNMTAARNHAGIDGSLLLEEVSASALRQYLGADRAQSMVFGTATGSANFPGRVTELCRLLREANGFRAFDPGPVHANDDKLDVVAWLPFADQFPCQVIVFGQCKTGTTWSGQLGQLRPDAFITKWVDGHMLHEPIRAFCISEASDRTRWGGYAAEAGLLFDRCRLVDCCDELDRDLSGRISRWNKAALSSIKDSL